MNKILSSNSAESIIKKLKQQNKKIVICGGCFDILHIGHIKFLQKAKQKGDILILFLESDEAVKKLKGPNRPINSQNDRAQILSSIIFVDYIINLEGILTNADYDNLILKIKPDVIAATKEELQNFHIKRQAKLSGAKVSYVIGRFSDRSTSNLAKQIAKDF